MALSRHLLLLLSKVPFKCLSRQSFECRDKDVVLDVVCAIVRLSRHRGLTLLLDNFRGKLIIIATNFQSIPQDYCRDKLSVDFISLLLIFIVTKFEMS